MELLYFICREWTIRARTDTIRYEYSSIRDGRYRYEYSVRWCPSHLYHYTRKVGRMQLFYAMGGTLHPRLNMQTISNTPTCALSQFYDWSICRNVSMIDSWDSCYHCLLVGGGGCDVICRWLPVLRLLVSVSRGRWYQVTVSLLPPYQPSPLSWIIWRSRARQATSRAGDPHGGWPARMSFDLLFNATC